MKNTITDLNNHLFAQLERLSDEEITPQQLAHEIERGKALNSIALTLVQSHTNSVEAMKVVAKSGLDVKSVAGDMLKIEG